MMIKNIKWVVKNILIGVVLLYVTNLLGIDFNISIPINIITILVVGFLRIPGLTVLLIISKL
ncbi:MAG: SigmaK-factor processing regulatory protein BofA [Haloplasmataceae bacterium]|nr:SigmaK-factor processing regulatory protein BofA [Haloplasmataceae bacterium]